MPVVKPSAPWNEELHGLRGQYKSSRLKDRTHASIIISFFEPEIWTIINNRSPRAQFLSTHRSVRLHGSSNLYQQSLTARSIFEHAPICSPSYETIDYFSTLAFNGSSNGHASIGTDLLFASISTAEHRVARAILERHHARVTSQLFGPEVFFPVFFMVVWFHMACTKL